MLILLLGSVLLVQVHTEKFKCLDGGGYIAKSAQCDGFANCYDGSDETSSLCSHLQCPQQFRCSYGACIDRNKRCDNKADCNDASDELHCDGTIQNLCGPTEFKCPDGLCIAKSALCDGFANCYDGSDETSSLCSQLQCRQKFRCSYGACIDRNKRCDNKADCNDASDEVDCDETNPTTSGPSEVSQSPCYLPVQTSHSFHELAVTNCGVGDRAACLDVPGTAVKSYSVLKYSCDSHSESQSSVCVNGRWNPSLSCYKLCPPLKSISLDVSCFYKDLRVACDEPVTPSTKATAYCKPHYQPGYQSLECQDNGKWNGTLHKCDPTCGLSNPPHKMAKREVMVEPLIQHGDPTEQGEFPWLASIYHLKKSRRWEQVCGGTLILTHIILTAAHCVYSDNTRSVLREEDVRVGLGKYHRDYYKQDKGSIIAKVSKIVIPDRYVGRDQVYDLDIALLDLEHSVEINTFVLPACVDWKGNYIKPMSSETIGYVAGWGKTEHNTASETILSTRLRYVDNVECKKIFANNTRFIVHDKFCATSLSGSQVLQGDSGGGLTILKNRKHYVMGLVSTKVTTTTEFSLFTEVSYSQHLDFMKKTISLFRHFHDSEI